MIRFVTSSGRAFVEDTTICVFGRTIFGRPEKQSVEVCKTKHSWTASIVLTSFDDFHVREVHSTWYSQLPARESLPFREPLLDSMQDLNHLIISKQIDVHDATTLWAETWILGTIPEMSAQ